MRDILLLLIIGGLLVCTLKKPQCGVLTWIWISVMNPHREAFGWIQSFPILDIVAGITIVSALIHSKDIKKAAWQPVLTWLLIFYLWCSITSIFSVLDTYEPWLKFTKSLLPCVFILLFMNKRHWMIASILVFVVSIAAFGIKGGLFTVFTGGGSRVYGPPNSSWGDNNGVSIAMLMVVPLLFAIRHSLQTYLSRNSMMVSAILCFVALLGTQSRGGLVGLVGQALFAVYRSNRKMISTLAMLFVLSIGFVFMPANWTERMFTISTDESKLDQSASNRIIQWYYAIDIANVRPLFASGFNSFYYKPYYYKFVAHLDENRAVHSNYFQVLGEQGYIGLLLYLAMWITFLVTSQRHAKIALKHDELIWAGNLLKALQYAFVGYAFNGLTVNMAYLDLPYFLMAFSVLLITHVRQESQIASPAPRSSYTSPSPNLK